MQVTGSDCAMDSQGQARVLMTVKCHALHLQVRHGLINNTAAVQLVAR